MKKIILIVLALLYILSPFDLLPDIVPGWGWIDDLILIALMVRYISTGQLPEFLRGNPFKYRRADNGRDRARKQNRPAEENTDTDKTPYEILGVPPTATTDEIRTAYRRLAGMYHPDKVHHLGDEFQQLAAAKFKAINQAYQELIPSR